MTQAAFKITQFTLTLLVLSAAVFFLIGLMPGDPVDLLAASSPHMTPEDAARLKALYGLDKPVWERYLHWLMSALRGDLGYSRLFNLPVAEIIPQKLGLSVLLMGISLLVTLAAAIPLSVLAARFAHRLPDKIITATALAGVSLPPFWIGLLLIMLFAVLTGWLPASASLSGDLAQNIKSLILPVATLSISGIAVYIRHIRSGLIATLQHEYIKTARAKGCSEARILWSHALRATLIPVITLLMLDIGTLVGGAVTVETIFAFPGMGKLLFDAVMGNDYNLALCGFLILASCIMLANLTADLLYPLLDPRVRKGGSA